MNCIESVLIVDDDPKNIEHHLKMLSKLDVCKEVHIKTNGKEALQFIAHQYSLRKSLPSFILCNFYISGISVVEFLKTLKSSDLLGVKNIPVAVLSDGYNPFDYNCIQNLGYCVFNKPLCDSKILEIIHTSFQSNVSAGI
jgi:CheY-like chemotaxis protein